MFPKPKELNNNQLPDDIFWELRDHSVSKQLDIIVYDAFNYPTIFRDRDFVILRPESVKSVIEVKGALDRNQITNFMELLIDFAKKWAECNEYYKRLRLSPLGNPGLFVMSWCTAIDTNGNPKADGSVLRKKIIEAYRESISPEDLQNGFYPLLRAAYIYNDCYVGSMLTSSDFAYGTFRGQFIHYNAENNSTETKGDKTVSDLLNEIQSHLDTPYNYLFTHVDQARWPYSFPHPCSGIDTCYSEEDVFASHSHIQKI